MNKHCELFGGSSLSPTSRPWPIEANLGLPTSRIDPLGYQRKELQLLGGGFNLLPPVDKTPQTDYLLAQNWRVDREGKLVSRWGYPQKFAISGPAYGHSAAVYGGVEGAYYVAANARSGANPGAVYFNFGSSPIVSGLSGSRVGMVPMNGWMWIMDSVQSGKHNVSSGFHAWNINPPANPCVPSAPSNLGPPLSSVTYAYNYTGNPAFVHSLIIAGTLYQFAENGYAAGQLAAVIAGLAATDPNCVVTASGSDLSSTNYTVTITPRVSNVLLAISGSDGNLSVNLATGTITPTAPNGSYQFYVTFQTADESVESNPSPVSGPITVYDAPIVLSGVPLSTDPQVGARNIYATGGTLGQAYLVGTVNDNSTTTFTWSTSDLDVTDNGVVMPTTNDPPPVGASGLVGPQYGRLFCWVGNRLFYTDADKPQYWPGSADEEVGNWVDVGLDGEQIMWCTIHTNVMVLYKERSIWRLVGDPDTGYLEQMIDGIGLVGPFAVVAAGQADYFVAPNGLYRNNVDQVLDVCNPIRPLFTDTLTNAGPRTSPGSILPPAAFLVNSIYAYAIALGYAMGKLYVAYSEQSSVSSTASVLLVYNEAAGRWMYHRNAIGNIGFQGFVFDGIVMAGLTGDGSGTALAYSLDDFRGYYTQDPGGVPIECVYQSHYEDAGLPDSQKNWLEVVVDYELQGDTATVYAGFDNGATALASIGTVTGGGRGQKSFSLGTDGLLAKNISVAIDCAANHLVTIHNVYLYYYEEARLATSASTIPVDLGSGKVKQCKELQLDIDASGGPVNVNLYSDLPGNQLAVRQTPVVARSGGRAPLKFPFSVTEGFLWRVALTAQSGAFRLYAARLLMRVIGVYVEAYEAANGFVWDSMEHTFDSGITHIPKGYGIALSALPIKRAREISLEIDTFNSNVTLSLLSDLPGNAQAVRYTAPVNTGAAGRRFVRLVLPSGTSSPIEGRMFRLQLSGSAKFILYAASVEVLPVGVYIEAYESSQGAVYDSRELDLGSPAVKEARELELDIETSGTVNVQVIPDVSGSFTGTASTSGRQKVLLPLNVNAAAEQFIEGRLLRLILSGTVAFRLYGARIRVRPFGQYLLAGETAAGALWDTTDLDLGTQTVKQLREVELDIWAYGAYTVTVYTDLPGNAMASRVTKGLTATSGRTKVQIPLPQGSVPDNYIFGRLARVTITSAAAFKLFGARIHSRAIGVYVESYEAAGGAVWDSTPNDLGNPADKLFDQVRCEMDSDGAVSCAVYTDLPGESFAQRSSGALTTGATSRHWATLALPAGLNNAAWSVEGRSIRTLLSSAAGFRIYKAQVRSARIGRYLAASVGDALSTLEFDWESERVKNVKKVEIDLRADGAVTFALLTSAFGAMAQQWSTTLATPNGRQTFSLPMPPGVRGRLLRIAATSLSAARIFRVRLWTRPVNEAEGKWSWEDYPLEQSDVLPAWSDLPVDPTPTGFTWNDLPVSPTPTQWDWAELPVNPTGAQWFWAKVLSVEETSDTWEWVDVPFQVN